MAFNATRELYLVSWNAGPGTASGKREYEVLVQRLDATSLDLVGPPAQRVSEMGPDGDWDWDGSRSAVAYNSVDDEFLAVWEGNDDRPPLGPAEIEIFGQRLLGALGVGGSVTGLDGRRVTCRNQTIPPVLTLDFGTSTSFACTASGLDTGGGDRISLRLDGAVADDLRPVGGTVTGMTLDAVGCRNVTTGQTVAVDPAGLRRWDCEAAGLVVAEGDRIIQRMGGVAD